MGEKPGLCEQILWWKVSSESQERGPKLHGVFTCMPVVRAGQRRVDHWSLCFLDGVSHTVLREPLFSGRVEVPKGGQRPPKFTRKESWPIMGVSSATPGSLNTALKATPLKFDLGVGEALRKRNSESSQTFSPTLEILKLLGWASCRIKENRNSGFEIISVIHVVFSCSLHGSSF